MFLRTCYVFFKQNTADEMRISDWSSDVCSSDLFQALPLERKLEIRIDTDVTGYFPIGGGGKNKDDGLSGTSSANPNADKVKPDRSEALMIRRERTPDDPEYGRSEEHTYELQ